jgi:hypothetical protein
MRRAKKTQTGTTLTLLEQVPAAESDKPAESAGLCEPQPKSENLQILQVLSDAKEEEVKPVRVRQTYCHTCLDYPYVGKCPDHPWVKRATLQQIMARPEKTWLKGYQATESKTKVVRGE